MILHETAISHLGLHLISAGIIDKKSIDDAAYHAKCQSIPLIQYLVENNILSSQKILTTCQHIFSLPIFDLKDYDETSAYGLLSTELIRQYYVIPLRKKNNILEIGLADPTDQHAIEAIAFHTRLNIKVFLIDGSQFFKFIETFYGESETNQDVQKNLLQQITLDDKQNAINDKIISYDEPLVKFVDNIILHAFQQGISDIHIESYETICRIRYRKHGLLFLANEIPSQLAVRIATRLKVMAKLNIAEKRLPQDGRFQLENVDIRINSCPTLYGEKIVLRLLNLNHITLDIHQLGFTENQRDLFIKTISRPQGMILVTGPTGSGKTVTLYSTLNYLNHSEKNISTVEDPIEIRLDGINQVNINSKIGLDFATVLRAFMRQDPDIIMIGEIRDPETAEIAVKASQTGHLVLSTLHTNSAAEAITRLRALGIPSYHIAESVSLIIAQRLIRKLCDACKIPEKLLHYSHLTIHQNSVPDYIYRANGCSQCTQGYTKRIAIYELFSITEKISQSIIMNTTISSDTFVTLKEIAIDHLFRGETSMAEINRVIQL